MSRDKALQDKETPAATGRAQHPNCAAISSAQALH